LGIFIGIGFLPLVIVSSFFLSLFFEKKRERKKEAKKEREKKL